jgi:hypothetical protein
MFLGGFMIKRFDRLVESRVRQDFEMLVNNLSAGILGGLLAILGLLGASPIMIAVSNALGSGVNFIINLGILPLVSIFLEPAKILFLNNAINHGILAPLAIEPATEAGRSILFLVETNPGPGFGILLAFSVFTRVAHSPIRKLGRDERFVSPALCLLELGHRPVHLATVVGVVLHYDYPEDEEAVELQDTISAEGERSALARYAGIEEDHPLVDLVVERLDRT